jgi:hypothetical protein
VAAYLASRDPSNAFAVQLAWTLLAAGALSASFATVGIASYIAGVAGTWLAAFGVAYSLLSATHATFAAIATAQGYADLDLSPIDPRGLATFGLAGIWMLVVGLELWGRPDLRPLYKRIAVIGGIDLILLYLATIVGSQPLILLTGGLASVILGPVFWAMTGRLLRG